MLSDVASAIGKGLFAGMVGTAAMTLTSALEMKLNGRVASDSPSKAAGKVLGVQPRNPQGKAKFESIVHWGYGTAWGAARGLVALTGLRNPAAAGMIHLAAVWGVAQVMLPSLDVARPVSEWSAEEVAIDLFHHIVYVAAVGAAYDFIDRH